MTSESRATEHVHVVSVQVLIPWHRAAGRHNSMPGSQGLRGRMSVMCTSQTGYKPLVIAEAYEGVWEVPVDADGNVYATEDQETP